MVEMSCEEHDRHAASTQFITHTVSQHSAGQHSKAHQGTAQHSMQGRAEYSLGHGNMGAIHAVHKVVLFERSSPYLAQPSNQFYQIPHPSIRMVCFMRGRWGACWARWGCSPP